jgi:hypothetical protein
MPCSEFAVFFPRKATTRHDIRHHRLLVLKKLIALIAELTRPFSRTTPQYPL